MPDRGLHRRLIRFSRKLVLLFSSVRIGLCADTVACARLQRHVVFEFPATASGLAVPFRIASWLVSLTVSVDQGVDVLQCL